MIGAIREAKEQPLVGENQLIDIGSQDSLLVVIGLVPSEIPFDYPISEIHEAGAVGVRVRVGVAYSQAIRKRPRPHRSGCHFKVRLWHMRNRFIGVWPQVEV